MNLEDDERALARRLPDRVVYVGVVDFRGPRGRIYRSIRTNARATEERAQQEVKEIRSKQYAHRAMAVAASMRVVDPLGHIIVSERI